MPDHRPATAPTPTTTTPTPPPPTAAPAAVIRPLRPGEAGDVRRIFRETLLLGRPLPFTPRELDHYEALCLDWYLHHGTVLVVDQDEAVHGYLLACLDQDAFDRWAQRRAVRWGARTLLRIAVGRTRGDARRFAWLRIRDGLAAWRQAPAPPHPAHLHVNLDAGIRDARVGHRLAAAMDDLVAEAGLAGWFGELNVPQGRSLSAVVRAGAKVVHRQPNRTFSWLLGTPVERATVARTLAERTDSVERAAAGHDTLGGAA